VKYGSARLGSDHRWHLEMEPHVAVRMKGIFPQIMVGTHQKVGLADTLDVCRDLAWFVTRYPLEIGAEDRTYLEQRAAEHERRGELARRIISGDYRPSSFSLALPPRDYQVRTADLLLANRALLDGSEVGVGKTIGPICTFTHPGTLPALVVCPVSLCFQWQQEIERFIPGIKVHILKTGQPYDLAVGARGRRVGLPDVVISSYHKLRGWAPALVSGVGGLGIKEVVFDEIQELHCGPTSDKYDAAASIADACEYRFGLSATPVINYGAEIWNIFRVLSPGALGELDEFKRQWCGAGYNNRLVADPVALGTYLRDQALFIRHTRAQIKRFLPPVTRIPQHVEADDRRLDEVGDRVAELARIILAQGGRQKGEAFRAGEELSWRLRQATGLAKAPYVADMVRMLVESGEKVLLLGHHREVYEVWNKSLEDLGVAMYTGSESPLQKRKAVERFRLPRGTFSAECGPAASVLVMALRASQGLNGLQEVCSVAVHGELDWSPQIHLQANGRLARDGQQSPVLAYYPMADKGSDPVIVDILGIKRVQAEGITDPDGAPMEQIDDGGSHVKALAEAALRQRGLPVPAALPGGTPEAHGAPATEEPCPP